MPRSSRHKSSKVSSKDVKEYSESEKDSTSRDRRSKEEVSTRASKDFSSGDKRKLDLKNAKESYGAGNGEHMEEYGSSKRRRDKGDDETTDRWNGGGDHDRGDKVVVVGNGESGNKSAGKEGRHRESCRKEAREGGAETESENKGREGRHERVVNSEDHCLAKQVVENTVSVEDMSLSSRSESQIDGSIRRRRDGSDDGNKQRDGTGDLNERISKDNWGKDARQKSEKLKDDKHKEKYWDDFNKESKHRDSKQKDNGLAKNHVSNRFDEKRLKDEKDVDIQIRKSKTRDSDRDRDHNGGRDWDIDSTRDRDRETDRRPYRDREDERKRKRERSHGRDYDQDSDRDMDRVRERERDHDHVDYDRSNIEDRSGKYKRSREKKRSPEDYDDYTDAKAITARAHRSDAEKKASRIDKVDYDEKRSPEDYDDYTDAKAITARAHRSDAEKKASRIDKVDYDVKRAASQAHSNSHFESEDTKYCDSVQEQSSKANYSRDLSCSSGLMEKGSKYRSIERLAKSNDGCFIEPFNGRSSSSKASPIGLVDRSSSANDDRRHLSRTGVRRSLDIEETGRRSGSIDTREFSTLDDRGTLDLPLEKPMTDESSQVESSFYRVTQESSSSFGPPAFRSVVESPSFTNSVEDNSRASLAGRYRRNNDLNAGRMHGNAWRGVSNWTAPMPNGFIPFQHHGGFQPMVPQFPTPPLFVRPLEINHSGMPYHIPDMERFSSSFRPLGWPNVMDASVSSNLHGWDGSNGVFRDESLVCRGTEWDPNGFMKNGRGWESNAMWKGQNGDVKTDSVSPSERDNHGVHALEDPISGGPIKEMLHPDHSPRGLFMKSADSTTCAVTPVKESSVPLPEPVSEKSLSPKASMKNSSFLSHIYLSKIEVSATLTYPELYNQCMNLLESEGCIIADDDTSNHKLIKVGARAGLESSKIYQGRWPFPPMKDFVFKKAMDLYKKQMMKERDVVFRSEESMDMKCPPSDRIAGEQAASDAEKDNEDPVAAFEVEMTEANNLNLENSKEEDNRIDDLNDSVEEVEDNKKLDRSSEKMEGVIITLEQVVLKPEGCENEPPLPADDKPVESQSNLPDKPSDDASMKDPFLGEVEGIIPEDGSNESGSVVKSRIHDHSPESTH